MEPTTEEVLEAVETLDGLQPSFYRDILEFGPVGDEEYTLRGDDLGAVVHAISVLKAHFGIVGSVARNGMVASPNRTVVK
jgi:hypothetical protein